MRARHWLAIYLLLSLFPAYAEETEADPPLELVEMLGEMDEGDADFDIAMSNIEGKMNENGVHTQEVKDDE